MSLTTQELLDTERTLHAAWRKRAEEAEAALAIAPQVDMELDIAMLFRDLVAWGTIATDEKNHALAGVLRRAVESLAALTTAPQGEREGWKLVPIKPTREMLDAAAEASDDDDWLSACAKIYRAMLDAVPSPSQVEPSTAPDMVERLLTALEMLCTDAENKWGDPHTLRHARTAVADLRALIEAQRAVLIGSYKGMLVLRNMLKRANLTIGMEVTDQWLRDMEKIMPELPGLSALR